MGRERGGSSKWDGAQLWWLSPRLSARQLRQRSPTEHSIASSMGWQIGMAHLGLCGSAHTCTHMHMHMPHAHAHAQHMHMHMSHAMCMCMRHERPRSSRRAYAGLTRTAL